MDKYAPTLHKAKRTDNGDWVVGYYVHLIDTYKGRESHRIYTGYAETDGEEFFPDFFEIDPETMEVCVGFRDQDSVLIFSNDIVVHTAMQDRPLVVKRDQRSGTIVLRLAKDPTYSTFEIPFYVSPGKGDHGDAHISPPDEQYPTMDYLKDMGSIHDIDLKSLFC